MGQFRRHVVGGGGNYQGGRRGVVRRWVDGPGNPLKRENHRVQPASETPPCRLPRWSRVATTTHHMPLKLAQLATSPGGVRAGRGDT